MKKIITILGLIAFLATGCSSSYLKDSSNVSNSKKQYDKILVVAKAKDNVARLKFENQVVQDFAANGIEATSSMSVIKTESFSKEVTEKDNLQWVGRFKVKDPRSLVKTIEKYSKELTT